MSESDEESESLSELLLLLELDGTTVVFATFSSALTWGFSPSDSDDELDDESESELDDKLLSLSFLAFLLAFLETTADFNFGLAVDPEERSESDSEEDPDVESLSESEVLPFSLAEERVLLESRSAPFFTSVVTGLVLDEATELDSVDFSSGNVVKIGVGCRTIY